MASEHGGSWLNARFEPELETQQNILLLELHNLPDANASEQTKVEIVELKVRIARAEDISGHRARDHRIVLDSRFSTLLRSSTYPQ